MPLAWGRAPLLLSGQTLISAGRTSRAWGLPSVADTGLSGEAVRQSLAGLS